ncbi:hypothetical protein I203_100980 [Kwoniella mangroviensis CBS 8507]|uniref:uncharacterized protein n=1 Tax=Kwoniella mangroviensis CBS 8507 TaxID=1296122 RepID=UPI00080D252C|nr:uncharacterized protein I203_02620 [Kwoniella mangroviensis CBS 8507]OCF67961.1 hypothetical protein I203_02620 [Kwoniella mangroviensis CBS 8507]
MISIAFLLSLVYLPYLAWLHCKVDNISSLVLERVETPICAPQGAIPEPIQQMMPNHRDAIVQQEPQHQHFVEISYPELASNEPAEDTSPQSILCSIETKRFSTAVRRLYNVASQDHFMLPDDLDWDKFQQALNLSVMVNTPETGRRLLKNFRMISTIGKHKKAQAVAASSFWNTETYDKDTLMALPDRWAWAYMNALHTCEYAWPNVYERRFWRCVSAAFLEELAPVGS